MPPRIRRTVTTYCDCGAFGIQVLEEDDSLERHRHPVLVEVLGPFVDKGNRYRCCECLNAQDVDDAGSPS